jgi:hypothetical protein
MVMRDFGTPPWLSSGHALAEVRECWRAVRPLADWLAANVADASVGG